MLRWRRSIPLLPKSPARQWLDDNLAGREFGRGYFHPALHPRRMLQSRNHGLCASILSGLRFTAQRSLALSSLVSGTAKMRSSRSISAMVCSASIRPHHSGWALQNRISSLEPNFPLRFYVISREEHKCERGVSSVPC